MVIIDDLFPHLGIQAVVGRLGDNHTTQISLKGFFIQVSALFSPFRRQGGVLE